MRIRKNLSESIFRILVLIVFSFADAITAQGQSTLISTQNASDSAILIITSRNHEDGSSQTGYSFEQDLELNRQGHLYKDGTSFINYRVNSKINVVNIFYNSSLSLLDKYFNNSSNTIQLGYLRRFKGNCWDKKEFNKEDKFYVVEQNGIKDTGYRMFYPVSLLRKVKKSWLQVVVRGNHLGYYYFQDSSIQNQSYYNWGAEVSLNQFFKNADNGVHLRIQNFSLLSIHHFSLQYKIGFGYRRLRDYYPLIKTDVYIAGQQSISGNLSKVNELTVARNQKPEIWDHLFYFPLNAIVYCNNKKDNGLGIGLQAQYYISACRGTIDFAPYLLIPFMSKKRNMSIILKASFVDYTNSVYTSKAGLSRSPIYSVSFNSLDK